MWKVVGWMTKNRETWKTRVEQEEKRGQGKNKNSNREMSRRGWKKKNWEVAEEADEEVAGEAAQMVAAAVAI